MLAISALRLRLEGRGQLAFWARAGAPWIVAEELVLSPPPQPVAVRVSRVKPQAVSTVERSICITSTVQNLICPSADTRPAPSPLGFAKTDPRRSRLAEKAALVTGGSSGIGFAVARALGEEGFGVTIAARRPDKLESAASDLRDAGVDVQHVAANMREEEDVK